ncbi:MAG: DUF417 family protein, partial [Planctomycetes bacterium]|nr:DUF417 family protein [Planctomycetota bacterium]
MRDGLFRAGAHVLRWGLVAILLWFGAFKFTAAEAQAIEPLVGNSPLLSWLYRALDARTVSGLIGVAEILIAAMIALRPLAPRASALGSLLAAGMFATTLSFLATTPGVWVRVGRLVVPNEVGAFLLKDVFLLGAALVTAAEARRGSATCR